MPPAGYQPRPGPLQLPAEHRRAILAQRRDALLELAYRAEVEVVVVSAQPFVGETVPLQREGRVVAIPVVDYLRDQQQTADNAYAAAGRLQELLDDV